MKVVGMNYLNFFSAGERVDTHASENINNIIFQFLNDTPHYVNTFLCTEIIILIIMKIRTKMHKKQTENSC